MKVFPGYIPYQWPALLCLLLLFCPTLLAYALAEVKTSQEGSLIWTRAYRAAKGGERACNSCTAV